MVQVDVFWSYGLGSGFALAAFRQLRQLQAESNPESLKGGFREALKAGKILRQLEGEEEVVFNNRFFTKILLFLAILFVPSGSNLLWTSPSWETMHVGDRDRIPGWLVSGFTITNVTQGILGYWVTYMYLMKGKYYKAALQTVFAYLGFFFILVNGWDNKGYQRFFAADRKDFENWELSKIKPWLKSDPVKILLAYGVFFIPAIYFLITKWLMDGKKQELLKAEEETSEEQGIKEAAKTAASFSLVVFGVCLGGAVASTVLIRKLGRIKGLFAFAAAFYVLALSKAGCLPFMCKKIMKVESLEGSPIWEKGEAS